MDKNFKTTFLSDFNFLRLLIATIILKNEGPIIDNNKLEKDLCNFYDRKEYNFLFEDICKEENNYLNLNNAFQEAYNFGLLTQIHDDLHGIRSIVNISKSEARQIQFIYSPEYSTAMSNLCNEIFKIEDITMYVISSPNPIIVSKNKLNSSSKEDLKFVEDYNKQFIDNNLKKEKIKKVGQNN